MKLKCPQRIPHLLKNEMLHEKFGFKTNVNVTDSSYTWRLSLLLRNNRAAGKHCECKSLFLNYCLLSEYTSNCCYPANLIQKILVYLLRFIPSVSV